jgi:acetyl esterase/lipase
MTKMDDAYEAMRLTPGATDLPPRWAKASEAFRARLGLRAEIAIPYGALEREHFDLFHPEGAAKGLLVFVHGGYWRAMDASSWSQLAEGALARGWAVAMPTYSLCPQVRISDITRQIARAVTTAANRVAGPVSLAGHSAGGHLVARMTAPDMLGADLAARLHHVVPISPLADLRPLMQTAMNADFRLTEAEAIAESPVFQPRPDVPVTVWVGGAELSGFINQARWLSEAWRAQQQVAPGKHHFDVIDALSDPDSDMVKTLVG